MQHHNPYSDFRSGKRAAAMAGQEYPKRLYVIDEERNAEFSPNVIKTARYNVLNFLPLFLMEQLNPRNKFANFYFACVAVLQMIRPISITGGLPSIMVALTFVLFVEVRARGVGAPPRNRPVSFVPPLPARARHRVLAWPSRTTIATSLTTRPTTAPRTASTPGPAPSSLSPGPKLVSATSSRSARAKSSRLTWRLCDPGACVRASGSTVTVPPRPLCRPLLRLRWQQRGTNRAEPLRSCLSPPPQRRQASGLLPG